MITEKLKSFRQTKLWTATVNLALIIILLNLICQSFSFGLDLTTSKVHSLSPATKEIIKDLDDIVTIKAFVSSNLPSQLIPLRETLKNTLEQYQRLNKKRVKIVFLDPQKDEGVQNEVLSLGITPFQFSTMKEDQFQMVQGYFGLAVFYAGKKQTLPAVQEINNLEYHLTSMIKKMDQEKLTKIAFFGADQAGQVKDFLRLNYQISSIDLNSEDLKFDPETEVLIIAGPKEPLPLKAKILIDQMITNEKGVIFLLDKILVSQNLAAGPVETGLDELLKSYGFEIEENLILDPSASLATFTTPQGNFILAYPFWIKARKENASQELPPTSTLETATFPWASSLKLEKGAQFLWKTTDQAQTTTDFNNLSPTNDWNFKNQGQQFIFAGIQAQSLKSFFSPGEIEKELEELEIEEFKTENQASKLIVVADANFIDDQTIVSSPESGQFFLNSIDYLSQENQLIQIRSKTVFSRPLKQIESKEKEIIKIATLASGPVILLALGIIVKWQRKRNHEKII